MGVRCVKAEDQHVFLIEDKIVKTSKVLAQGGYGYIYLAKEMHSKKKYALKVVSLLSAQQQLAFQKEISVMRLLGDHPNIIKMLSAQQKQNHGFILMELAKSTLWELTFKTSLNPLSEDQVVVILRQVASGLKYLHSKGLAHRDIKTQNVLIMNDGSIRICDFGSCTNDFRNCKDVSQEQLANLKQECARYTTAIYRPPELVDTELGYRIDQKMDMWMFGCVAYILCFYQAPFKGDKQQIVKAQVKIPTRCRISKPMQGLILDLLKSNPKDRPTASQVLNKLNSFRVSQSTSSGSTSYGSKHS